MDYYKILNEKECHNNMQYKTGLNTDILPFNPSGDCKTGGIYFSREDILSFLSYGCWIRKVTLPKDEIVYENPGKPKKWKAHSVYLGRKYKITIKVIKRLISEGAKVSQDAIDWAANNGHLEIVKLLLEHGAKVSQNAIDWAARYGHLEVVKLLLENGEKVSQDTLDWAARNGNLEMVKLLLENGAKVSQYALDRAARNGHLEVVKLLKSKI